MQLNTSDLKELGLDLKMRRLRVGLAQYKVAGRLGTHPGRLSEIECGRRPPSPDLLEALEAILSASPESTVSHV